MNAIERSKKLKEQNDKLTALLKDPEPGLFTWWSAVEGRVIKMNRIIHGEDDG
jgi:hypothetical protein